MLWWLQSFTALSFSPDGKYLVAGLHDSTILVFHAARFGSSLVPARKQGNEWNSLWADLAGENAAKAHQAVWDFIATPKQSVPFMRDKLEPAAIADAGKIRKGIADLDSDKFSVRQAAVKELAKVGDQVKVPIQKALTGNITLETRHRLEQILNTLSEFPSSETLRTIRAIMVLERIGSTEAQRVLESLARGAPGARETEEAKASLERLKRRARRMP
jgi:hypothetical protein